MSPHLLRRTLLATAALAVVLLVAGPALAQTSLVRPVYYVPTDKAYSVYDFHDVQCGLGNTRRWYARELPNDTVEFAPMIRYDGAYTSSHCIANMGDCIADITAGTGIDPWDSDSTRNKLLVIGRGFLGWAGGTGDTAGRGYAVVGAESLTAQGECAGNWWCTEEIWNGTVAHELGHTFSLPHSSDDASIMKFHGDYKNKGLTGTEPGLVESDPASRAKGTNWTACENDYDCQSRRCGCNGSNAMVCLPTSAYPTWCSGVPNWSSCRNDSDCASGYCAPDHQGNMACLPSTAYVYCGGIDIFYPEY